MHSFIAIAALLGQAVVQAQNPPAPTPSNAVIIEGDASYDGPVIPGTTGKLGNAQVVTGNPVGVTYRASFPNVPSSNIHGYVSATSGPNGVGAHFSVSLAGLPPLSNGPFLYHIHVNPVPANGNCSATGGHVDPYMRGAIPPCDSSQPATCQVGDLSGKHGNITSDPFTASYDDPYVSLTPGNKATLVGKSITIHSMNVTRIACANFVLVSNSTSSNSTSSNTTTASSTPSPFTPGSNAVGTNVAGVGVIGAGLFALFALYL